LLGFAPQRRAPNAAENNHAEEAPDERTRTAFLLITSALFLLDEQPALDHLGLRPVYWTATKVKVGTICVHVLSNSRKYGSAH
jgi:hypothetical protein